MLHTKEIRTIADLRELGKTRQFLMLVGAIYVIADPEFLDRMGETGFERLSSHRLEVENVTDQSVFISPLLMRDPADYYGQ